MHSDFGFLGSRPANLIKCFHTIDRSLLPCLGGSGGSDAPSLIGAVGSGGLGLALLEGGGLGSPKALDPCRASTSF